MADEHMKERRRSLVTKPVPRKTTETQSHLPEQTALETTAHSAGEAVEQVGLAVIAGRMQNGAPAAEAV